MHGTHADATRFVRGAVDGRSVNAVTREVELLFASHGGSQLAGYTFTAEHVVWVVGAQKIVPDLDEAFRRARDTRRRWRTSAWAASAFGRGRVWRELAGAEVDEGAHHRAVRTPRWRPRSRGVVA